MPIRPFQFTLAGLMALVLVAAVVLLLIREAPMALALGVVVLAVVWFSSSVWLAYETWNRLWQSVPMRLLLAALYIAVAVAFSPILLFCLDWERHVGGLIRLWRRQPSRPG